MLITPVFSVSQDEDYVYVEIRVPHIRISSAELLTDGHDFSFFCKPYILKLSFPFKFKEELGECKAVYDPIKSNGTLVAQLPKLVKGEHFPDLDLISTLMVNRPTLGRILQTDSESEKTGLLSSGIEVLNSCEFKRAMDWETESNHTLTPTNESFPKILLNSTHSYGFNLQYSHVFDHLREDLVGVLEVVEPDKVSLLQRRILRIRLENQLFDPERYLGDWLYSEHDDLSSVFLQFSPFWIAQWDMRRQIVKERSDSHSTGSAPTVAAVADESAGTVSSVQLSSSTQSNKSAEFRECSRRSNCTSNTDISFHCHNSSNHQDDKITTGLRNKLSPSSINDEAFERVCGGGWSEEEQDTLTTKLRKREYLIRSGSLDEHYVLLGLIDLLFAFCYDHRITGGEANVESAHNICRISSSLSWMDSFSLPACPTNPVSASSVASREKLTKKGGSDSSDNTVVPGSAEEACSKVGGDKAGDKVGDKVGAKAHASESIAAVIKYSLRRSLVYPYLRVWRLSRKVLADVAKLLYLGRRAVLKCLLAIRKIFEHTDTHYLLNKVFIDDYCVWIQTDLTDSILQKFAKLYNEAKTQIESSPDQGKGVVGLWLVEIEAWAREQERRAAAQQALDFERDRGASQAGETCDDEAGTRDDSSGSSDDSSNSDDSSDSGTSSNASSNDSPCTVEDSELPAEYLDYASLHAADTASYGYLLFTEEAVSSSKSSVSASLTVVTREDGRGGEAASGRSQEMEPRRTVLTTHTVVPMVPTHTALDYADTLSATSPSTQSAKPGPLIQEISSGDNRDSPSPTADDATVASQAVMPLPTPVIADSTQSSADETSSKSCNGVGCAKERTDAVTDEAKVDASNSSELPTEAVSIPLQSEELVDSLSDLALS